MRIRAQQKHPKSPSKRTANRGRPWAIFGLFLAVVFAASSAAADQAIPPTPPVPAQWVTDSVRLLPTETSQKLNARLGAYERKTGHQVIVWIGATSGVVPIRDFAVKTFASWQLGRKKLDDGLLLMVLAQDRKIAIEVGYGLEGRVPDATAARIINDVMVPKLRAGDPSAAVVLGVEATLAAIDGAPFVDNTAQGPPNAPPEAKPSLLRLVLLGLLILGFIVLALTHPGLALSLLWVLASGGRGGGGGFGGGGGGGGFGGGGGGRSGGGGASGSW